MPNAARMTDKILQDGPHCHAPIHPAALVPTPAPHPAMPLTIILGQPNVLIGGMPAARLTDMSQPCMLAGCVPGGPGMIAKGSATVLVGGLPAARATDMSQPCMLAGCIPAGPGLIAKGSATVLIGGLPAARVMDLTSHPTCVAPIPSPTGKILPPGCPTVMIGG